MGVKYSGQVLIYKPHWKDEKSKWATGLPAFDRFKSFCHNDLTANIAIFGVEMLI